SSGRRGSEAPGNRSLHFPQRADAGEQRTGEKRISSGDENRILRYLFYRPLSSVPSRLRPMAVDHIRYDILARHALRGVVRRVLTDAAAHGLPGEHHFLITFDTGAEGVEVSARIRAQYPAEMMIVLQHQFWDLRVNEDRFEVGLSFSGIAEKLVVPFAAIK